MGSKNSAVSEAEPHDVLRRFSVLSPDVHTLLFYPYSLIVSEVLGVPSVRVKSRSPADSTSILFVRRDLYGFSVDSTETTKAIRSSWLDSLEKPKVRKELLWQGLTNEETCRTLYRYSGLTLISSCSLARESILFGAVFCSRQSKSDVCGR